MKFTESRFIVKVGDGLDSLAICEASFEHLDADIREAIAFSPTPTPKHHGVIAVPLTVVTSPEIFDYAGLLDWLHEHSARAGTLHELAALYEQQPRAKQLVRCIAPGTHYADPTTQLPIAQPRRNGSRLHLTGIAASWPRDTSFIAVRDQASSST